LSPDFAKHVDQAVTDFDLLQVAVFNPAGDIIYSTIRDDGGSGTTIGPFPGQKNREEVVLLLTDVILPKRNGRELYNKLAQSAPQLPVLCMSGHTQDMLV
jgi:CheY-like chemotaxis protein